MPVDRPTKTPLLDALRARRVATARELARDLDSSQPTISRGLADAGGEVVRIGQGRNTRYAATRNLRGMGDHWLLYRIDDQGRPQTFGRLTTLYGDGCLVVPVEPTDWFRDEFNDGLFPGLPWFLDDMRPQGFLGRLFGQRCAPELGLDPDILRWNEDAELTALLLRGDDGPGNFVLGDKALERALGNTPSIIPLKERGQHYAALAKATQAGEQVGSSAAGEQPKFTACIEGGDEPRHVIVKFSDRVNDNPVARRWADLLICEQLASQLLTEVGHASAYNDLVWSDDQLFLESTRFDRPGLHGRRGFVSLAAWSDAHDGVRDSWPEAAERMHQQGWIDADAVDRITSRWWFGRLIGNTDMHFGNLGFFLDNARPLSLCPSYDMLPMLYRPASNGSVVPREFNPPAPLPATMAHWQKTADWASTFWRRVARHDRVSKDFAEIASANRIRVNHLRQRFG